jgi:hypothetical protein
MMTSEAEGEENIPSESVKTDKPNDSLPNVFDMELEALTDITVSFFPTPARI